MYRDQGRHEAPGAISDGVAAALFRGLFKESLEGVLIVDADSTVIQEINPAALQRLQMRPENVDGILTLYDLVVPEEHPRLTRVLDAARRGERPTDFFTVVDSSGVQYLVESYKILVVSPEGEHFIILTRDVTMRERERAFLQALVKAHHDLGGATTPRDAALAVLRSFERFLPNGTACVHLLDPTLLTLACIMTFGHPRERALLLEGTSLPTNALPALPARAFHAPGTLQVEALQEAVLPEGVRESLLAEGCSAAVATTLHTIDGAPYGVLVAECRPWPAVRPDGTLEEGDLADTLRAVAQEVGSAIDRARKRQMLQNALDEQRRLNAELSTFAYRATHDLSEPLRGIETLITYAVDDMERGDITSARDLLRRMNDGVERLRGMLSGLLELNRGRDVLGTRDIGWRLVDVVHSVTDELAPLLRERSGRIFVENPMPEVIANRPRVHAAMLHLLSNALRYNPQQSPTVWVSASERGDGWVEVSICDNGPGIPPGERERIFDLFRAGAEMKEPDPDHPDNGDAGLAVARAAMMDEGGDLWVQDAPKGGADFRFILRGAPQARSAGPV